MSAHTPGPWTWWTSNSWKRLKREGRFTENVLEPYVCRDGHPDLSITEADMNLIAAAPDMKTVLDELEETFDVTIHPEQVKDSFDAPDDREYDVTITAKQWRALSRAISKAEGHR